MKIIVIGANHAGTSFLRTLKTVNPKAEITAYDRNTNTSFLGCGIAIWVGGKAKQPDGLFYSSPNILQKEYGVNLKTSHEVIEIDRKKKVKSNLEKQQKEFLLREKLKAIKESLSENDSEGDEEDDSFSKLIHDPKLKQIYPESVLKIISTEKERLKGMMSGTPDANVAATYISTLKKMPWRKIEVETLDIKRAKEVLDKNHYGLEKVKERIIEYLSLIINHKNLSKKSDQDKLIDIDKNYQIDMSLFKENDLNSDKKGGQ